MIRLLSGTVFRKYPQMYHKYERMGFNTPSKKVEIYSPQLEAQGKDGLPVYHEPGESPLGDPELARAYPLVLTTGAKLDCYVHSQMRNIPVLKKRMPQNVAEIHPESAAKYGVVDGDRIQVETKRGVVRCMACVTKDLIPGVVQLYHGFTDANANHLIDNRILDPITGSAAMSSAQCRIRKA